MDSFELNKVAGAVLGTLLFAFGLGFVSELIYEPKPAGNAGYALPEPTKGGGEGGGEASAKPDSIATRLASADPEKGKGASKACQSCHSFEKGGLNKIGPGLYEVVERPKGSHEGFDYSAGLKGKGGNWTYEDLDHFIENPKAYASGTKMAFAGINNPQERANVIAYLRTLAESPKPLPAAEKKEEGKKDDAKTAEGGKKDEAKAAEGGKKDEAKAAEGGKKDEAKSAEGGKKDEAKAAEGGKKDEAKSAEGGKEDEAKSAEGGKEDEAKAAEGGKKDDGKEAGAAAGNDAFAAKVASADPAKGKAGITPCQACHSFVKGAGAKVGPDLYDVVGRKKGSAEGFAYSAGMKEKGGEWTYDDLNTFLTKPADYVKGTKMAFPGVPEEGKRAEIVAYLRTLSESPKPLPGTDKKDEGKAAETSDPAKPADAKTEAEKKPDEAKPADKPAGAEPADQPAAAKPEEKKSEEAKPAEAKPEGESKPEKAEPAEDKPADQKAEEKPTQQ